MDSASTSCSVNDLCYIHVKLKSYAWLGGWGAALSAASELLCRDVQAPPASPQGQGLHLLHKAFYSGLLTLPVPGVIFSCCQLSLQ